MMIETVQSKNRMYRIAAATFAALLCFSSASVQAQDHPDLTGTWKLNLEKSNYGDMPGPSDRTDTIEQRGGEITESVVSKTRNRVQHYTMVFSTDGRKTMLPPGVDMGLVDLKSISAIWQGPSLVATQVMDFQGEALSAKNIYTLSDDGRTLTIAASLNGGGVAARYVFDRVP